MPRFGLKLGIGESTLARTAETLWRSRGFDFLELFIPLDASADHAANWRWYDGVLALHAPHAAGGFNFAQREKEATNFRFLPGLEEIRHRLHPAIVVFHPGLNGSVAETLRQIEGLARAYPELHRCMALENKPRRGMNGEACLGASPREISELLGHAGCGFCLDVRHACAYAAADGVYWRDALCDFASLNPCLWHAADGNTEDVHDSHDHIGEGRIPWALVAPFWRKETLVTIECEKRPDNKLRDFLDDTERLRRQCGEFPRRQFSLRNARAADAEFLWRLANDPDVRAASFNPDPISWEDHEAWVARQLESPEVMFCIALDEGGQPIGQIRFHKTAKDIWDIGVSVVASARRAGLGTRIIAQATERMLQHAQCRTVRAWIKPENRPSCGAFAKAGYRLAAASPEKDRILMIKETAE